MNLDPVPATFRGIYLESGAEAEGRGGAAGTRATLGDIDERERPPVADAVTIDVAYSSINYKDALAITGQAPVVRRFPMVPGIDLAGRVAASDNPSWQPGDEVLVTGWGIGETYWGGLAARAQADAAWLIARPRGFTLYDTMAIGTAGHTAALALLAIQRHGVGPDRGAVLVTGATGGVGSLAIMLLAAAGYHVVASTGKPHEADYLRQLGAAEVIDRATLSVPGQPLQRERWAAAVDTVGSHTLANVCASTARWGVVATCGLAQGMDFPATVAPFILRGITLVGIHSVMTPHHARLAAWAMLDRLIDRPRLRALSHQIPLAEAIPAAATFLAGTVRGRLVVDVTA